MVLSLVSWVKSGDGKGEGVNTDGNPGWLVSM